MRRAGLIVRIVYALCLAVATANHVRAIAGHGLLPDHIHWPSAAYWASLTLIDPLAVVLLFARPRAGIALTAAIIVTNVAHNLGYGAHYRPEASLLELATADPFILSQIAFLVFVAATAPIAWRAAAHADRAL